MSLGQSARPRPSSTPEKGISLLKQVRFDVWVTGLPGLDVQLDLEPGLFLAVRVRDLDDHAPVVIDASDAVGTPQELQELLTGFWVYLDPHFPRTAHFG
jgi:hypothetical protein